jgi:hypothetical protein
MNGKAESRKQKAEYGLRHNAKAQRRRGAEGYYISLRHTRIALGFLIALVASGFLNASAFAQAPERTEALVYATTYYNGLVYGSAFAPPQADTIYLLADRESVIAPRRTLIYFWPLTSRYLADWDEMNELVKGTLEISQGGRVVSSVPLTDFVVQYDEENPLDTLRLHTGAEAQAQYEAFEAAQDQYRRDLFNSYQAYLEWREARDLLLAQAEPGSITEDDLPEPPEQPEQITLFSTEPRQGYVIALPEGSYRIQMRLPDGSIVPESEKVLVVFGSQEEAISYNVVPQQRWTRHEESNYPGSVIYALDGTTIYLQSYRESEYNEFFHKRLQEPQDAVTPSSRTTWVRHEAVYPSRLAIRQGGRTVKEVPLESYFVQQLPGNTLGYEVIPFDPETMERPSFQGYQVDYDFGNADYSIELVDEDGQPIPGSQRQIRVLRTERALPVYLLSGLPFLVGVGVFLNRRQSIRKIDKTVA